MTVRFLIVMVALAALATESGLVAWRLVTWRRRVDEHARTLNSARSFLYDSTRLREWHDAMRRKYERGLASPWLRVEPDPPPPP